MKMFEVGKTYGAFDSGIDPITIERRTKNSVYFIGNRGHIVRQKIHVDADGVEYTYDSYVPLGERENYTHSARFEE